MSGEKKELTEEELTIVAQAWEDLGHRGRTSIRCPRCGEAFRYIGDGIECATPGCVGLTVRGRVW